MGSLTALLLATPIFGFSLQAPMLDHSAVASVAAVSAELRSADTAALQAPAAVALRAADDAGGGGSQSEYVKEIKRRNSIASIHRTFGIATWTSMTLTVAAGFLAYYNLYGFGAGIGNNPCVKGTAVGGDWGCDGIRPIKNSLAVLTTALYATTFTLSLMMPDPDNLSEGKGEFASTLRLHKTLRWVHFGGMVAQVLMGLVLANGLLGLDRANHYAALQALATVHMGVGLVTWGALTWAGALMVF
jgi:hypothetical protein